MSQLGEQLRQARENNGLSLAQAASETRIRQQFLEALEAGKYDALPNDVVTKGFIRNYAQFLQLSAEELIDLYRLERGGSQPIRVIPTSSMPQTRSYVLPSFFGVFFVTIALVALAYITLSALGRIRDTNVATRVTVTPTTAIATPTELSTSLPPTAVPPLADAPGEDVLSDAAFPPEPDVSEAEPAGPAPAPEEPAAPEAAPTAAAAAAETPAPTSTPSASNPTLGPAGGEPAPRPSSTPTQEAPIVVEVSIPPGDGEGSWLRVQTDGVIVYEQIMGSGERQVFLAQRQVQIRAGNPTFVQVGVNGLPPETIGQVPGEPVDWSWPPQ